MIEEYKEKKKELDIKFGREQEQIEAGKQFEPSKWVPELTKMKEANEQKGLKSPRLAFIDNLETAYAEEYKLVTEKDFNENKDPNDLAFEQVKKATYYFEFIRV